MGPQWAVPSILGIGEDPNLPFLLEYANINKIGFHTSIGENIERKTIEVDSMEMGPHDE